MNKELWQAPYHIFEKHFITAIQHQYSPYRDDAKARVNKELLAIADNLSWYALEFVAMRFITAAVKHRRGDGLVPGFQDAYDEYIDLVKTMKPPNHPTT